MRRRPIGHSRALAWCDALGRRHLALFAMFVAVSLLTRWLTLIVGVIDIDESAHIVGGWEIDRGRLLYRDFVDNKPPR